MPDWPPAPEAESPQSKRQPEVDELAKGLPGLPVEAWGDCVGDQGFAGVERGFWKWQRRRVEVPWRAVRTLQTRGNVYPMLEVVFVDADGGFHLCELMLGRGRAKVAIEAWREYVLRRAQSEGALRGEVVPLIGLGHRTDIRLAMIIPTLVLMLLVAGSIEAVIWDRPPEASLFWRMSLVGVLLMGMGVWFAVAPIAAQVGEWLAMRRRDRWELGPSGLLLRDGESFVRLDQGSESRATPDRARIGEFDLRLRRLSTYPIVAELLLAFRERLGLAVSPAGSFEAQALWAAISSIFVAGAFAFARGRVSTISIIFLAIGVLLLAVAPLALWAQRRRLADSLARGRAMLERLGW